MSSSDTNKPSWLSIITNNSLPRRRDGPWAWVVLAYIFLCGILFGGLSFGYGVILPALMVSLNDNRERTALVGSLAMGIGLSASPIASKLSEHYTCRIANGLGFVMTVSGLILSSLCQSVYPLYFTYSTLIGLGISLAYNSGFIAVRQYFNKRCSLAMGIASAGSGLGTLIIGPAMHALMDRFGWENTFRIMAGVFVLLLMFVVIEDPNVEAENNNDNEARVKAAGPPSRSSRVVISSSIANGDGRIQNNTVLGFLDISVWRFPEYTICVISIFVSSFGQGSALIHMVKFSEELSVSNGSTLFVFFGSATVVSRLICGRLCDVSFIKPRYVHQVGAILSGVSTILLSFAQTYTHLIIFAVFYGIADGAFRVTLQILFMNTVDVPRRPSAFGQANMVTSVSLSAGPAIAGLLADKTGSYAVAFIVAGAITIFGGSILFVHLCFFKSKETAHQGLGISDTELANQDYNKVGNAVDHPLSCVGPGSRLDKESQTTSL